MLYVSCSALVLEVTHCARGLRFGGLPLTCVSEPRQSFGALGRSWSNLICPTPHWPELLGCSATLGCGLKVWAPPEPSLQADLLSSILCRPQCLRAEEVLPAGPCCQWSTRCGRSCTFRAGCLVVEDSSWCWRGFEGIKLFSSLKHGV